MDAIVSILKEINCEELIDVFNDHQIDSKETAYLLGDTELKEIIPKIGPRLKFKQLLRQLKAQEVATNDQGLPVTYLDEYVVCEDSTAETGSTTSRDTLSAVETPFPPEACSTSSREALTELPISKKNNGATLDGRAILREGQIGGGLLREGSRRKLSQLLIHSLLEQNPAITITTEEFYRMSTDICELFAKESVVVYYSAYMSSTKSTAKKNASGKLYESYVCRRRKLRESGDLPSTNRSSSKSSVSSKTSSTVSLLEDTEEEDSHDESFLWLKNNVDPWQTVEEKWKETKDIRLKEISKGEGKIEDYFRHFSALKQPQGYTLLLQDFRHMYPGKENHLFAKITLKKENIIEYAKKKLCTTRDKYLKTNISDLLGLIGELDRRKRIRRSLSENRVVITQHFTERTVTPGGDISMQCAATGDRPPQFMWERDGVVVSSNTDPRYALGQLMTSDNSVAAQLNITRVRVEDGGLYSCTAREGDHVATHENRLDVYGPPYIRKLDPIKIQSGESLNLRCPFYGYPISKIDWEYKGKTLSSNNLFQTRYKRNSNHPKRKTRRNAPTVNINGILTIPEVSKEVNGEVYTCIVTSPSGEMAKRAFEIQVIVAPVLEDLLLGNNLQEGQIVNIYCNVRSGDLPIYFEWLKDGKRIPSSLKVVERSSELFSALVIKNVSLEHCGTYTCVASNHVAKVNRSTELYIKVAPKWLEEPSNSSLLLGRRGTVSCSASGYPQPQVHWMKKDGLLGTWQPVLELAGGGILSLPNGTLVIEEVSLTDEGLYSCNVENGVGQPLSKTVWMSINKPVHFETSSRNVTSRLGHPVTLECRPLGDDPIRVTWTHDGIVVDFQNRRVKLSDSKTTLGLTSTISLQYSETADAGLYQCRASNPYGTASFNVQLTILEPPTPPSDLRVESVRSRGATITWRDILRAHARFYSLQYAPTHYADVWDHATIVNVTRKENDVRQSLELQNLRPATAYGVKVATGNQVGVSVYTAPVHFTTHEEAPSSAPISVQVEQTENPGELFVSWMPPLKETHNGIIMGYHVKAVPQNGGSVSDDTDTRTLKVSQQSGKQETLLSGLLKNTRYSVLISAFTSAGSGPFSLPVYQDTREGAPEQAPSSVECTAVSTTSLRVGWQPIALPGQGSSLVGYTVLYATEDGAWQNQTSLHTELYLQALLKYTNYTVKVAGFSNFGAGPFSYPTVCATLQDVPGPPADIKVLVVSSTSLLISWKKPNHPNGELLYYTVYVKPTSSNGPPQTLRVEAGRTVAEAKELTSGRTYETWVTASTRAGEGAATRRVTHTPTTKVVAGVASLGGTISVGVGSSLLLVCQCVGVPPPRTVWYHKHNIITHHPRFTRNHDDSLLINNIDQSLSGNYTCLAKNLYGSDSVEYTVIVLPLPDSPILRATPYKDSILVEWEQPYYAVSNRSLSQKISYSLTWKEASGPWQEAWPTTKLPNLSGVQKHALTGLRCGTKYSLRITATNRVGTSQPAYLDVSTLGGVPVSPSTNEWLWSNCSHIVVQLAGWDDGGCELRGWEIDYKQLGGRAWIRAHNTMTFADLPTWNLPLYQAKSPYQPSSFAIADLSPGTWYQIRVTASNEAGSVTTTYSYATKNDDGSEVGPPSEGLDLNTLVILCSSILLAVCVLCSIYIIIRRQSNDLTEYRDPIADNKSESGNLTANTSHSNLANTKENSINAQNSLHNRIYSAPIHMRNNSKHELYEISPYAQFAVGFRTFGHVDNQDLPSRHAKRYDTETSFQVCSESEDSDSISKSTLKSVPRKACRTPHHR